MDLDKLFTLFVVVMSGGWACFRLAEAPWLALLLAFLSGANFMALALSMRGRLKE